MYLFTFVFLIIGILGIYTQVLAVQTARLFAGQTGIAQAMVAWHDAALSLAGDVLVNPPVTLGLTGCSLSLSLDYTGTAPPACTQRAGISSSNSSVAVTGTYTDTASGKIYPYLSPGYQTSVYLWNSIAFQANSGYYVITYVPPPATNVAPALLDLPGPTVPAPAQIGITSADLIQQLNQTGIPIVSYGIVSNTGSSATLFTSAASGGTVSDVITYPVPPSVPNNSIAIISTPNPPPCSGC